MAKAVVPSSIVFEVLEKDNYEDWRQTIQSYLEFKDLWDVVESNEQPPDRDADEAKFKDWKKQNSEALHAIQISCGRHFLSKIRGIREANKAWRTLQANFIPPLPRRMEYTINPQQGDEENVDDEYREAYKSLADALSRRDISDAIELCKKDPALLKERLPNYTPLLHQLIMLCTYSYEDEVVEILKLDHFPKEALEMRDSLGRTPLIAALPGGAIRIARCLVNMNPTLIHIPDDFGLIPLAVAIESFSMIDEMYNRMIDELYCITPSYIWTLEDGKYGATLITMCFQVREFDFASKLLKEHPHLTVAKDVNGISPLYAAARAPRIFQSRIYKFPQSISNFLLLWLPLHSMDFKIFRIELLIAMKNAIKRLNKTSGLLRDAFFEAIKCGNFNFIVMLINADKKNLEEVDDMWKNIYMCAIEYRQPKVFSLFFWDKNNQKDRDQYANVWQDKWKNNVLHMAATWTPYVLDPSAIGQILIPAVLLRIEVMWFLEVRKLVPSNIRRKSNVDGKTPRELLDESHKDLIVESIKRIRESTTSWSIVGPLVITIMFAAAFQIPEGYNQEKGFPIFLNKKLFKFYMVLISISLFWATISVLKFLEILSSNYREKNFLSAWRIYNVITGTLFLSLATMLVAFGLGLFLTLHGEFAIFFPIAVIATFLVGYIVYTKLPLLAEIFPFYKWRNSLFQKNIGYEVERIFEMLNRQPTEEVAT